MPQTPDSHLPGDRLESWKEIASHLGKTVRTVQRWEKVADLPVHRLQHDAGATVFAYRSELDAWFESRSQLSNRPDSDPDPSDPLDADEQSADSTATSHTAAPPLISEVVPGPRRFPRLWHLVGLLALVGAIWVAVSGDADPPVVPPPVPEPLTTDPGIERSPALSPDGKQLVYVGHDENGGADLYVRLVSGERTLRLTNNPAVEESPSWAPDGLTIAFLRRSSPHQRALLSISAFGGTERRIDDLYVAEGFDDARSIGASIAHSPDGRWIAATVRGVTPTTSQIIAVEIETGRRETLTDPPAGTRDLAPAYSPDGSQLAFTRSESSLRGTLQLVEVRYGQLAPPTTALPGARGWNTEPAWTPDGKELFFASGRWPRTGLWRLALGDSTPPRPVAGASQRGSQPSLGPAPANGSREGRLRLVYTTTELDNDIWRHPIASANGGVNGEEPTSSEPKRWIASSQRERFPSYAPDGRIAFLSDRSGHREVWVGEADGSDPRQWTQWESAYVWRPSWSPDGSRLAYAVEVDGTMRARVQDAPLTTPGPLLTDGASDDDLAWSHDPGVLYVSSSTREGLRGGIWRVAVDDRKTELVVQRVGGRPLGDGPQGRYLYLSVTGQRQGRSLERILLDGESEEVETIDLGPDLALSFTMGSDGIYYVAESGGRTELELRRYGFEDQKVTTLIPLGAEPEPGIAIAPDEMSVLVAYVGLQRSDLMLLDGIVQD